jgi:hypothetical protein
LKSGLLRLRHVFAGVGLLAFLLAAGFTRMGEPKSKASKRPDQFAQEI